MTSVAHIHQYTGHPSLEKNAERYHLNDIMGQMDKTDICKTLHPNTAEYTMFSAVPGAFSKLNHVIGHQESPHSCRQTEVIFGILPNHNGSTAREQTRNH